MLNLTPRLQAIADFVEKDSKLADIGTDHAYIPVYLVREKVTGSAIASDLNAGPFENAKKYVSGSGLSSSIDVRLGSGMEVLSPGEVDTVIIAGMGGILIADIMETSREVSKKVENFILQPMVGMRELRTYLQENGYKVAGERLANEGNKYYQIIHAVHGRDEIKSELEYEVSSALLSSDDPLLKEFLELKLEKTDKIIESIERNSDTESEKLSRLKAKRSLILEALKDVD